MVVEVVVEVVAEVGAEVGAEDQMAVTEVGVDKADAVVQALHQACGGKKLVFTLHAEAVNEGNGPMLN